MFRKIRVFQFLFVVIGAVLACAQGEAKSTFKDLSDFNFVLSTGILQGMIAKETCSCRYVTGIPLKDCQERSSLPEMVFSIVTVMDDPAQKRVTVYPAVPLSRTPAMAIYNTAQPRKGCRLVYGMKDAR